MCAPRNVVDFMHGFLILLSKAKTTSLTMFLGARPPDPGGGFAASMKLGALPQTTGQLCRKNEATPGGFAARMYLRALLQAPVGAPPQTPLVAFPQTPRRHSASRTS